MPCFRFWKPNLFGTGRLGGRGFTWWTKIGGSVLGFFYLAHKVVGYRLEDAVQICDRSREPKPSVEGKSGLEDGAKKLGPTNKKEAGHGGPARKIAFVCEYVILIMGCVHLAITGRTPDDWEDKAASVLIESLLSGLLQTPSYLPDLPTTATP